MSAVTITLPWENTETSFSVPEANLAEVLSPNHCPALPDLATAVAGTLDAPIGLPPMSQWVKPTDKVLIISDDNTRLTPAAVILPPLLERLGALGVKDGQVTVLMALGTHRYMTEAEMKAKVGEEIFNRVRVVNHLWREAENLVDLGKTSQGTPLVVNRLLPEADLIIALGAIVPHHIPGFSGGAKIIQPGVCGPATTAETHFLSCCAGDSFLGTLDNPVRRDMDEMAAKVGLKAICNVVLNHRGEPVGVFFGHFQAAFKKGAALARQVYGAPYSVTPDIVVANSHPCDIDFWQAHKSMYPAMRMVRPGGVIVIATPCPEGISPVHTDLKTFTRFSSQEIQRKYRSGELSNGVAVALATAWAMVREKASVMTYSTGLSPEEVEALGHTRAESLQWAIDEAIRLQGPQAKISVLTHAPDMLPIWAGA